MNITKPNEEHPGASLAPPDDNYAASGSPTDPETLLRNFCARYYGEVSPLIDKKMVQALLHRHGAEHDLTKPYVQEAIKRLELQGLIRFIGRELAYIKMLGAT